MTKLDYRPDIDGLRAIAVLAVVGFHLGLPKFGGGHVGVDVFFVLSGWLISDLILRSRAAGEFRFVGFYARRARRLFPALFTTIALTLLAGYVLMLPEDFARAALSGAAALFSLSNLVFWSEAGYWDVASSMKPLLHTWSLGVEEQFYLVWPAFLLLIARSGPVLRLLAAGGVMLAGYAAQIWMAQSAPDAAFYLTPFRLFQFAAGAFALFLVQARPELSRIPALFRDGLSLLGLALVIYAVVYFFGDDYPGWRMGVPTVGAMLLLIAGAGGTGRIGAFLALPGPVWIGRISYALYLVHWPVIALYVYRLGGGISLIEQAGLFVLMLSYAGALHYAVERRFYRRAGDTEGQRAKPGPRLAAGLTAAALLIAIPAGWGWRAEGWPGRADLVWTPQAMEEVMRDRFATAREACRLQTWPDGRNCPAADPERPRILVIGNSHEADGYNFLRGAVQSAGREADGYNFLRGAVQSAGREADFILFGNAARCGGFERSDQGWRAAQPACQPLLDLLLDSEFLAGLDALVYSANQPFRENKSDFIDLLGEIKQIDPDLSLVSLSGYLNTYLPCAQIINITGDIRQCRSPRHIAYFAGSPNIMQEARRPEMLALSDIYIDRIALLCPGGDMRLCAIETPDGDPAFLDRHHLSRPFAEWSGAQWAEAEPAALTALLGDRD